MKTIVMEEQLAASAEQVWEILSDTTRSDWVPSVESITEQAGVRSFVMAGIGEIQERILRVDHAERCLQYSAIKTPSMVAHHLATMQVLDSPGISDSCRLLWTTEIEPDQFADAITQGMQVSIEGLKSVLAS